MFGIEKDFQNLMEQVYGPLNKDKMTEIEKVKAEIKVLQSKLLFLEEMENHKTPCEIAYKDWMGMYPPTNPSVDNIFDIRWRAFQMGYNAADTQKLIDEEDNDKNFKNSLDLIKEWGEKNKPKTLYQICMEWWEDIFTVHADLDADACIDVLVDRIDKEFIPPSSEKNGYEWEKCLKIMREKLR